MIKNLRPLIKVLDFQVQPHHKDLLEGFHFIQEIFRSNKSLKDIDIDDFPLETIPDHLKKYLIEKDEETKGKVKPIKSVHPYRYEFYVYDQLNKYLASNKVYANDTTQYKNFSDDIKLKKTAKEKKRLLNSLDAPRLNREAIGLLDELEAETEGSNQIMFALMYFANIDYTPCYRSLRKKANKIYGFKNPSDYPVDYLIKPLHKVNKKLIIEEWANIQDIVMAILSKETSVSIITRKLCSNELKGKTKRALWELNNILRSIYLLRYIDEPDLRQFVRAALNRIEAYHLLRRNIGETNGASFRVVLMWKLVSWRSINSPQYTFN